MPSYAEKMTAELARALAADGYLLPDAWPAHARVCSQFTSRAGWNVETRGGYQDEPVTVYIAPDGSQWTYATRGARVGLVCLSKKLTPALMRVLPGTRRPRWLIEDMPKGEVPEQLRRFLVKPGERLRAMAGEGRSL